jgi:hypothetical protein
MAETGRAPYGVFGHWETLRHFAEAKAVANPTEPGTRRVAVALLLGSYQLAPSESSHRLDVFPFVAVGDEREYIQTARIGCDRLY